MPRSRSRKKRGGRQARGMRIPDSVILTDLLGLLDRAAPDDSTQADWLLLEGFERAAWSFHGGPGPRYAGSGSLEQNLARLRAREWFLFEFELPSGLTAAEEWVMEREGEPGSAGDRRAVSRFVNSECGIFDVREVGGANGWMLLAPLPDGDAVTARPIERGFEMLPGFDPALPEIKPGDTIAGRLYWLDDDRAELSAGTCPVSQEARTRLLADPPPRKALRSGLALEAILGADASMLLSAAADARYPSMVNSLLSALSDGTFEYRRLWRELEGEADPVGVTRQLLSELDGWTEVEAELLAWAVAGAWFRRREAAAGRAATPEALARERHALESHVRTVLDVPGDPVWPVPAAGTRVEISGDDTASIEELEPDENEWIVDVGPADWREPDVITFAPFPFPLACAIVEQAITPFDDLEAEAPGGDEQAEEDEDEDAGDLWRGGEARRGRSGEANLADNPYEGPFADEADEEEDLSGDELDEDELEDNDMEGADEGGPLLLHDAIVNEGEDDAEVSLEAIVETLLAEGRVTRPSRIVFRQRAIAARLGETLRDAGLEVALLHFTGAVDVATMDVELEEAERRLGASAAGPGRADVEPASSAERRAYERLADAGRRAREDFEVMASNAGEEEQVGLRLTLAQPLAFPFITLEGVEKQVGSVAIVVERRSEDLLVRVHLAAPGAGSRFDCRGPAGDLLIEHGDAFEVEIREPGDGDEEPFPGLLQEAGLGPPAEGPWVVPVRFRYGVPPAFPRGRELEVAAGVLEAAAAIAGGVLAAGPHERLAVETHVEPLGDVTVERRGSREAEE